MKYAKIEAYFATDEGVTELLSVLKEECFDIIDDFNQQIISGNLTTQDELRRAKSTLTGIFSYLQPIYSKALSLKKQKEYRYCVEHKADGSAASVEKASKDAVAIYRDVRDILCGYLKSAEALMYDCKDRIEQERKEYIKTKEEN